MYLERGSTVTIHFKKDQPVTLNNVTQIHYHNAEPWPSAINFLSDEHGTGVTYEMKEITEIETYPAMVYAEDFERS